MKERNAGPMAGFFKFTAKGQAIAGIVKRHFNGDNGHAFILSPCVIKSEPDGETTTYQAAAVGLSTDMLIKVDVAADVGKCLLFEFVDTEASKKGSPRKIFRVGELTTGELDKMFTRAKTNIPEPYQPPSKTAAVESPSDMADEDDELPF